MLTEKIIREAKPRAQTFILWDDKVKGLGLRIARGGTKAFVLNYRAGSRVRRATLARASEISLKDVRALAGRELVAIRNDNHDPLSRRADAAAAPTVNAAMDRFFGEYVPARIERGSMSESTAKVYRDWQAPLIRKAIGKIRVRDVARGDIERMVKPLKPVARNRMLALVSRLFNLFEHWELRPQHTNPARGVERTREQPRDRILSSSELAALSKALVALEVESPFAVAAIRLAAITGLRIGEVLAIRWENVDFETGRLTMPETKTGRRTHDLPSPALAILAAMPRINGSDFAFSIGRNAPITYGSARLAFLEAAKDARLKDVRLHDLRRTVMTAAAASGVGTHVLRDLLGHKTAAMADRYIRAVGNPVKEARERMGVAMAAMMEGRDA